MARNWSMIEKEIGFKKKALFNITNHMQPKILFIISDKEIDYGSPVQKLKIILTSARPINDVKL